MDTGSLASCRASVGLLPLAFTQRYQRTSDLKAVFVSISVMWPRAFFTVSSHVLFMSRYRRTISQVFGSKKCFIYSLALILWINAVIEQVPTSLCSLKHKAESAAPHSHLFLERR